MDAKDGIFVVTPLLQFVTRWRCVTDAGCSRNRKWSHTVNGAKSTLVVKRAFKVEHVVQRMQRKREREVVLMWENTRTTWEDVEIRENNWRQCAVAKEHWNTVEEMHIVHVFQVKNKQTKQTNKQHGSEKARKSDYCIGTRENMMINLRDVKYIKILGCYMPG